MHREHEVLDFFKHRSKHWGRCSVKNIRLKSHHYQLESITSLKHHIVKKTEHHPHLVAGGLQLEREQFSNFGMQKLDTHTNKYSTILYKYHHHLHCHCYSRKHCIVPLRPRLLNINSHLHFPRITKSNLLECKTKLSINKLVLALTVLWNTQIDDKYDDNDVSWVSFDLFAGKKT